MARVCPGYKVRGQGIFAARATHVDFTAPLPNTKAQHNDT